MEVSSFCPTVNDTATVDLDHCRSILFASFVASGFVPMIHACVLDGTDVLGFFPLAHALGMVTCYLTGTIFYLSRFPERRYPVKYDIWVRATHISKTDDLHVLALTVGLGVKPPNIPYDDCGRPAGVYQGPETISPTV